MLEKQNGPTGGEMIDKNLSSDVEFMEKQNQTHESQNSKKQFSLNIKASSNSNRDLAESLTERIHGEQYPLNNQLQFDQPEPQTPVNDPSEDP